jgi:BirA family biotin operon repressor/biotin-[acetyl-CoA-carboxylase] ligase
LEVQTSPSTFDLVALRSHLGDKACRFDAEALGECDSTNARLMARAEAGAPSGTLIVADRQTAGRGRRGRQWHSADGDSLAVSLLWRFPVGSGAPMALSLATGVAVAQALESLGGSSLGLKWPNDVLHAERKLAGILIELVPGAVHAAVVGIGLNLRRPADLPEALRGSVAALDEVLVTVPSRETVLAALLGQLAETFTIYTRHGFAALRDEWQARHVHKGRSVRLLADDTEDVSGICLGVDLDGALLLDTGCGRQRFIGGEISLRPT